MVLLHVLLNELHHGLRRSRNFGFLHPNSAAAIRLLHLLHLRSVRPAAATTTTTTATAPPPAWRCACGQPMRVVCWRMPALAPESPSAQAVRTVLPDKPEPAQAHTMH